MALMDQTLEQLRGRTARLLDDYVGITATGNGTTTTFVDTFNVNTGTESFDGCEIRFTSGANDGLTSRITTTTASTGTLTFTPSRTSTATSDTAELFNRRNRGFRVQDYHNAINDAIEQYQGIAMTPVVETIATAFDVDSPTVAIPSTTLEVYLVEYLDDDSVYQEIPRATPRGGNGWTAEPANAVLRIEGPSADAADGQTIRLHGFKRQTALSVDTSVTAFDSTVLVYTAATQLCLSGISRDPKYAQMAVILERRLAEARNRIRMVRPPGTQRVRL